MRIKALSANQRKWLEMSIVIPVVICMLPVLIPIALIFLILVPFEKLHTKYIQRQIEKGWFSWYAWYPVRIGSYWESYDDKYVWLETIEIRRHNGYWNKRLPLEETES